MKKLLYIAMLFLVIFIKTSCAAGWVDYVGTIYLDEYSEKTQNDFLHEQNFLVYPVRNYVENANGVTVVYSIAVSKHPFNIFGVDRWSSPVYEINNSLQSAATSWVILSDLNTDAARTGTVMPYVVFQDNRSISVVTRNFLGSERRFFWYIHAATVNMETGERITLDDLIYINDDFIRHLQNGNFIEAQDIFCAYEASIWANQHISELTAEEVRAIFESASIDSAQTLKDRGDISPFDALMKSNTFFLMPGRVVIIYHNHDVVPLNFILNIEDIYDFLRVQSW